MLNQEQAHCHGTGLCDNSPCLHPTMISAQTLLSLCVLAAFCFLDVFLNYNSYPHIALDPRVSVRLLIFVIAN
jgi:hypothetical protein